MLIGNTEPLLLLSERVNGDSVCGLRWTGDLSRGWVGGGWMGWTVNGWMLVNQGFHSSPDMKYSTGYIVKVNHTSTSWVSQTHGFNSALNVLLNSLLNSLSHPLGFNKKSSIDSPQSRWQARNSWSSVSPGSYLSWIPINYPCSDFPESALFASIVETEHDLLMNEKCCLMFDIYPPTL